MTDLEMTRLCAEAMGQVNVSETFVRDGKSVNEIYNWPKTPPSYDPLHDDAQAMALVKKLGLICITELAQGRAMWRVHHWREEGHGYNANLNLAIVECVAQMETK